MNKATTFIKPSGRMTLGDTLRMLINDGIIDKAQAEKLYKDRRLDSSNLHPLVVIGEQKWKNLKPPLNSLNVEWLSSWLAGHAGLDYYHIDPLKLDFGDASQVVSKGYAERLKIMPISIKNGQALIATSEPFNTDWVTDLERVLKMKIKLVVANPLELNRYLPEMYNLVVNTNHELVSQILNTKTRKKQERLINQSLDLARLSQGLLKGEELTNFVKRSYDMIK